MVRLADFFKRLLAMSQTRRNCLVAVSGCTGSGKSDLGIAIAKEFDGEVISADSMQIYKGLDIVTNKVTQEEMQGVPHHLMSFHDPRDASYNVHLFREAALDLIDDIWQREKLPVIVGGTAYYLESVLYADNLVSGGDETKPEGIRKELDTLSNDEVYERLKEVDPEAASFVHRNNRFRVQRALEIFLTTGRKKSEYLREQRFKNNTELGGCLRFPNTILFNLDAVPDVLDHRLNRRVENMAALGLREEIEEFYDQYAEELSTHGVMQSIGIKEFLPYLKLDEPHRRSTEGHLAFVKGCEELQLHTRQYSRRQRNWLSQRILKRSKTREVPLCFTLDTSTKFYEKVVPCAVDLTKRFMAGEDLSQAHSMSDVIKEPPNEAEHIDGNYQEESNKLFHCDTCTQDIHGAGPWQSHLDGKKHKALLRAQKKAAALAENAAS